MCLLLLIYMFDSVTVMCINIFVCNGISLDIINYCVEHCCNSQNYALHCSVDDRVGGGKYKIDLDENVVIHRA
jgi:hypothetical protein